MKCGECRNQAFLPVIDQVILDHLRGRVVAGVYPLLEDDTCWFLAIDFDKGGWQADVSALVETCCAMRLPAAVERSRSGERFGRGHQTGSRVLAERRDGSEAALGDIKRAIGGAEQLRLEFESEDRFQKERFEKDLEYMQGGLGGIDGELETQPKQMRKRVSSMLASRARMEA